MNNLLSPIVVSLREFTAGLTLSLSSLSFCFGIDQISNAFDLSETARNGFARTDPLEVPGEDAHSDVSDPASGEGPTRDRPPQR